MVNNLSLPGFISDENFHYKSLYNRNNSYIKFKENKLIPIGWVDECICSGGGGEACVSRCGCTCTDSGCRTFECKVLPS